MLRLVDWVTQIVSSLAVVWLAWGAVRGDDVAEVPFWLVVGLIVLSAGTQLLVVRQRREQAAKSAELPPGRLE